LRECWWKWWRSSKINSDEALLVVVSTTGPELPELFVNVGNIVKSNIEHLNNIFKYLEVINYSGVNIF